MEEFELLQLFEEAAATVSTGTGTIHSGGGISSIRVLRDRETGFSKGFALVAFRTLEGAQRALETLQDHVLRPELQPDDDDGGGHSPSGSRASSPTAGARGGGKATAGAGKGKGKADSSSATGSGSGSVAPPEQGFGMQLSWADAKNMAEASETQGGDRKAAGTKKGKAPGKDKDKAGGKAKGKKGGAAAATATAAAEPMEEALVPVVLAQERAARAAERQVARAERAALREHMHFEREVRCSRVASY